MNKILVFSWFFPPVNSSEGLVTYKLLKYSKYTYDIFTQKNSDMWSYGKRDYLPKSENLNCIFAEADTLKDWENEAIEFFERHSSEYDIIMTRSMPEESHKVGMKLKEEFPHIIWIASFGDPIKSNPYSYIGCTLYSYYSTKNRINSDMSLSRKLSLKRILKCIYWNYKFRSAVKIRKSLNKLETDTLKVADCIILNNESQKHYMIQGTIEEKTIIIPHSYDAALYKKRDCIALNKKIRFCFIGHLDDIRTAYPLLKAIQLLCEDIDDLKDKVIFEFYGDMSDNDKLFIIKNDLMDIVKLKKPISYLESLEIMQQADWLIHIDGNISSVVKENIFFAAKIVDYFGSGSNIIAITMQDGAVVDELRMANALVLSYSAEEIKNYLYLIVKEEYKRQIDEQYIAKYDASRIAVQLDEILDRFV